MSVSSFFISEPALRHLKQHAQRNLSGVSSSHLSEAIAAALGFRTHAALRAALSGNATAKAQKPKNILLVERLRQLGHDVPGNLKVLPELKHSYTPFNRFPLRKKYGVRWWGWRNLMVSAINVGLERRLFGLSPRENWWPGSTADSHDCPPYTYRFQVDYELPAVASVKVISGDELSICVILNPVREDVQPQWYCGLKDGQAVAHGWLERRLGAWIQDGGEAFRCKRVMQSRLADMAMEPAGYSDQGSFLL